MPKEVYDKEAKQFTPFYVLGSLMLVFIYIFIFSIFDIFCVCFDFWFWLLYLICESIDFFNIRLSLGKNQY